MDCKQEEQYLAELHIEACCLNIDTKADLEWPVREAELQCSWEFLTYLDLFQKQE